MQVASAEFGKFQLLEEVGRGPISTIHRAVLRGLQGFERQVAIKRMLPEVAQQANFVRAFIDQAKLLAMLDHTNIVKIYDFGRVEDRYFIAMEYVEDSELLETCCGRKMPPEEAAHIVQQVCSGLHYGHERGLVHGDLNPANVLLCEHSVKLIDFGIAQLERVALTEQPAKRKWGYLSPEQVEGSPPTPWSDIFSAGAILWELLTGEPLFEGFAPHVTLGNILKAAVPPIAEYQPDLLHSKRFDAICQRALARQPADRYQDAGAMVDDLIAALESTRAGLCLLYGGGTFSGRGEVNVLHETTADERRILATPAALAERRTPDTLDDMESIGQELETLFDEDNVSAAELMTKPDEARAPDATLPEEPSPQRGDTGPHLPDSLSVELTQPGDTGPHLPDSLSVELTQPGDTGPHLPDGPSVELTQPPGDTGPHLPDGLSVELTQPGDTGPQLPLSPELATTEPDDDERPEVGNTGPHLPDSLAVTQPDEEPVRIGDTGPQLPEPLPPLPEHQTSLRLDVAPEKTEVRAPSAIAARYSDELVEQWEEETTGVAARAAPRRSPRPRTGPQIPMPEPRRWEARGEERDADAISPARARAMSSMMRTMAERSRQYAELARRRRSINFILWGMLLVSLTTNVVLLVRSVATARQVEQPTAIEPERVSVGDLEPDAATAPTAPSIPAFSTPDLSIPAHARPDAAASAPPSKKRRPSTVKPEAARPKTTKRDNQDTLSAVKEAISAAGLSQQLQRLVEPCGVSKGDGLRVGVHISSAGRVRRVFVAQDEGEGEGEAEQAECARNNLLKAQLNVVLPLQTYMEWRFAPAGAELIRVRPSR